MTFTEISSYAMILIALKVAPGPSLLMLIVRSLANDISGAVGFGFGTALGGLAIITAVCFGLSEWIAASPKILDYSKYVMMAYLFFIARGIWIGGFDMTSDEEKSHQGILPSTCAGIMTSLISPYYMILLPLALPGVLDLRSIEMPNFLIIALTTFLAIFISAIVIIIFAGQFGRLLRSQNHARTINRGLASLLVIGGGFMAFS